MKAVVLVGGTGTRLRPLTYTTPKPLLPIANIPFVERQLDWLGRHGVDEAVLSLGYLPDAFTRHFADERHGDMKLRFVVEHEPLGTAGGIRFAAEGIDERLIVCNGDVLTDLDLGAFVAFHEERGAEATISLTRVDDPSAFGVVPTRSDGEVIAFVEKPPRDQAPSNWINAGTYVLEPAALAAIPPRLNVSIERETFPRMLERPGRLYAMRSSGYWLDIGTPGKYFDAQMDVLTGRVGPRPTPDATEATPGVWIEPDAVVDPGADLNGPVLIGAQATVAAGATVTRSVVGANCAIGADAVLREAVVLDGCEVAAGAEAVGVVVGADGVRLEIEGDGMKALITGGAGFIGSTLADRLLAEDWSVDVADDLSSGNLGNLADARAVGDRRFSFHRIDIRNGAITDLIATRRPDVVFHLAAQADVRVSVAKPQFDAEVNVVGLLNVCEGARAGGASKVVFASSGGTIYGTPQEIPTPETHPQRPESPYGVAKKAGGDYLHYYRTIHGLDYAATAFSNVYGPRQDPHGEAGVVSIFAGLFLARKRPTIFGDGNQTRDFVFVDDVADALVRAATVGEGIINIGTGVETSVNDLYGSMARATGVNDPPSYAPARQGELERSALAIGRAKEQLGWEPFTSLDDGVAKTLDYFRDRK